jgi:hypothetical protein
VDLNADQLAQFRGCFPENPCYHDCCEAAQRCIDETCDPDELARALAWAATETWI